MWTAFCWYMTINGLWSRILEGHPFFVRFDCSEQFVLLKWYVLCQVIVLCHVWLGTMFGSICCNQACHHLHMTISSNWRNLGRSSKMEGKMTGSCLSCFNVIIVAPQKKNHNRGWCWSVLSILLEVARPFMVSRWRLHSWIRRLNAENCTLPWTPW